jgi:hypothetical protein
MPVVQVSVPSALRLTVVVPEGSTVEEIQEAVFTELDALADGADSLEVTGLTSGKLYPEWELDTKAAIQSVVYAKRRVFCFSSKESLAR